MNSVISHKIQLVAFSAALTLLSNAFMLNAECGQNCCGVPIGVEIEGIYARASTNSVATDSVTIVNISDPALTVSDTKVNFLKFDRQLCYRVRLFNPDDCCNWTYSFVWTHLQSRGKTHTNFDEDLPSKERVFNEVEFTDFLSGAQQFCVNTRLNLFEDYIDLTIAHPLICDCICLQLTPRFGIRGLRSEQKFSQRGSFLDQSRNPIQDGVKSSYHNKNKYYGLGVIGGLALAIDLPYQLELVGEGDVAWLYGRYHEHGRFFSSASETGQNDIAFQGIAPRKTKDALVMADLRLGLDWSTQCCGLCTVIGVGWDQIIFFDRLRFDNQNDDLFYQGVSLKLNVEF